MKTINTSVVISTYNNPEWLQKVLWSYDVQTFKDFEVVIADDGSSESTRTLIETFRDRVNYPIQHIWHADNGFQKTKILNKAIIAAKGEYLVFTDGDCIARKDFLKTHIKYKAKGYFLSGGYFKLPMDISKSITEKDIKKQNCFDIHWLRQRGLKLTFKANKITAKGFRQKFLNAVTPTKATWNGHNASGFRVDILSVNGFDERMQYGGEDRELGERLFNIGIKAKQIRYSAVCLHLDHQRGYVKQEMIEKNLKIRARTKKENLKWTDFGIKQG